MMLTNTARKPGNHTEIPELTRGAGHLMSRKIWLPRALYAALPFFYIVAGIAALAATLYISDWFWILPHYLLFSAATLHMGILVFRKRRRL
jgi:fatty acid desaturase